MNQLDPKHACEVCGQRMDQHNIMQVIECGLRSGKKEVRAAALLVWDLVDKEQKKDPAEKWVPEEL